jgi:hypothetical protein
MTKKKKVKTPAHIVAAVARKTESLKASGAQRVLVVYEEASVRMYEDRAEPPPPRESA